MVIQFIAFSYASPLLVSRHALVSTFTRIRGPRVATAPSRRIRSTTSPKMYQRVEKDEEGSDNREQPPDVRRLASLFWRLARPYWAKSKQARRDLGGVLALTLLQSGISVAFSYISRDFWTALNTKDMDLFLKQAGLFFVALSVFTPIVVYYQYYRDRCALRWRDWLSRTILHQYVTNRNFYSLDQDASAAVDNPDQRIAQDLSSFTYESLALMLTVLVSCIDLVSFSAILFSIYPPLFGVLLAYAATGTALTSLVGRRLVSLNYSQLVKEADFRYSLIRFRENAESVAFFRGEKREQAEITRRLQDVVANLYEVIGLQRNLGFLQTGYRYLIQVLPAVVVAPLYFKGQIELGSVTQSFSSFSHILNDLSLIVNRFDQLSQFGAGIERLGEFVEELEKNLEKEDRTFNVASDEIAYDGDTSVLVNVASSGVATRKQDGISKVEKNGVAYSNRVPKSLNADKDTPTDFVANSVAKQLSRTDITDSDALSTPKTATSSIEVMESDANGLSVHNLTLMTPSGSVPRKLINNLSFQVEAGQRLLVAGPSGVGKSSLLRAISGLWTNGSGIIERPTGSRVFFLPQRPYCTLGTLRANLLYPRDDVLDGSTLSDEELLRILDMVDLRELPVRMGGFDATRDWADTLSLGEQQRLQFARLLIARPKLAVIDEGSAALSIAAESRMYNLLEEMQITVVSIGHRPSLLKYHDVILRLGGDISGWELEYILQEQRDRVVAQTL